jgi:hypothetical protein
MAEEGTVGTEAGTGCKSVDEVEAMGISLVKLERDASVDDGFHAGDRSGRGVLEEGSQAGDKREAFQL